MALQHRRSASSVSLSLNSKLAEELSQLASVAALAIPALGIVVVDPLISLVDTACIGRTSTEQLAALAPNSSVFNLIFQARRRAATSAQLALMHRPRLRWRRARQPAFAAGWSTRARAQCARPSNSPAP